MQMVAGEKDEGGDILDGKELVGGQVAKSLDLAPGTEARGGVGYSYNLKGSVWQLRK